MPHFVGLNKKSGRWDMIWRKNHPPRSTVCADINSMTSSYVQPNIYKQHDITSFFTFFSSPAVFFFPHFAWVCGSVPLLSGPPDSALTVRQRSRKMAVIHFVPCHRRGSFFPSAHYLQTRLDISAGHTASFLSGPGPPYSGGLGLVDDPLWILSAGPACNHPAHSCPPPGKKKNA